MGLPKQTGNAHHVHVWCSAALQKLRFESLSSSAHRSSEHRSCWFSGRSCAGPRDSICRTWCFACDLLRFLWRKEDTRGAQVRDEIPELLVDAQASNTRTGDGFCTRFSDAPSRVGVLFRREHGSASRVTGAHGDAVGLGAFLLPSGEWCANSCATESFRRGAKLTELWSTSC